MRRTESTVFPPSMLRPRLSRRRLFFVVAGGLSLAEAFPLARPLSAVRKLIRRVKRPPQLETPVDLLDSFITPNDAFFVRSHFAAPPQSLLPTELYISGPGAKTLTLALADLEKMEVVELAAVLQCAGNGRALFGDRVPGVQWKKGAVGNARWRGVRLAAILERAGLAGAGGHVHLAGQDVPPHVNTPSYVRSIPMDRALDPTTLVSFAMNGASLPELHGGPLRLVVPGWAGNHWMKWLATIRIAAEAATGFFMDPAYRMPTSSGSSGPASRVSRRGDTGTPFDGGHSARDGALRSGPGKPS
jgi:DMSO/TMAO reductase YedYZ molybdopterin-dependent catalytic subunit